MADAGGVGSSGDAGPVLVSTAWLAARLGQPGVRVVDVRGKVLPPGSNPRYFAKRADYEAAHIPGAVFVDWTVDIVDPSDPVPMQVASPEAFAAKMTSLGIGDDTLVVAYDDYDHIFAGRLAWALRYYGHSAIRILDGGWSRWRAEGRPTDAGGPASPASPAPPEGQTHPNRDFRARPTPALRRTADEVERALGRLASGAAFARGEVVLIDARPADQYSGKVTVTATSRGGHIPGALNVPYARLVDSASGRFLPPDELRRAFHDAGADVDALPREIIVYCNGGVSCTVALNALRLLGRDDVAVYDGSWNEWGEDASRPIHTGHEP